MRCWFKEFRRGVAAHLPLGLNIPIYTHSFTQDTIFTKFLEVQRFATGLVGALASEPDRAVWDDFVLSMNSLDKF